MSKIINRVCELLAIEYPVIQGGMSWVSDASLAAAVSEGGGLGIMGAGAMKAETLREEIRKSRELTKKPFGINLVMINPRFESQLEVVLDEMPAVVTLGAVQKTAVIGQLKERGIKVLPVISAKAMALRAERAGADAIIAEGGEAGGHIGETQTMVLTPIIVDALKDDPENLNSPPRIPVICAGGVADGRGMAAAFVFGAEGVQIGTRFVCADECTVDDAVKEKFLKSGDRATKVTGSVVGYPVRGIKNQFTNDCKELEREFLEGKRTAVEIEKFTLGRLKAAMRGGNVKNGSLMAGQSVALVKKRQPAGEIISEIIRDAKNIGLSLPNKLIS